MMRSHLRLMVVSWLVFAARPVEAQEVKLGIADLSMRFGALDRHLVWPERPPSVSELVASARAPELRVVAVVRLLKDGNNHYAPAWSPDGRYMAFLRSDLRRRTSKILTLDLADHSPPKALWESDNSFEHMSIWSRGSRACLLFSSNREQQQYENVYAAVPGKAPRPLTTGPGTKVLPSGHGDGQRLQVVVRHENELVGLTVGWDSLKSEGRDELGPAEEANFSPDGTALAVVRSIPGRQTDHLLYRRDVLSKRESGILGEPGRLIRNPTWSPDGKWLAYYTRPATQNHWELWAISTSDGAVAVRLAPDVKVQEDFRQVGPSWSADGKRLWYFAGTADQGHRPLRWSSPDGAQSGEIEYPQQLTSASDVACCPDRRRPVLAFVAVEQLSFDVYWLLLNHL